EDQGDSKMSAEEAERRIRKYLTTNSDIRAIVLFDQDERPVWIVRSPGITFDLRTAALPDPRIALSDAVYEGDVRATGLFKTLEADSAIVQFVPVRNGMTVVCAFRAFYSAREFPHHTLKPTLAENYEINMIVGDKVLRGPFKPRHNLAEDLQV